MHRVLVVAGLLGAITLALAACGGGGATDPATPGPSGAVCPPAGTALRYVGGGDGAGEPADFGAAFLATYCLGCHGAVPSGGAPPHASLNTAAGLQEHLALIDEKAAAGPARTNTTMPPAGQTAPTLAERTQLGVWIACGAP